MKQGYPSEIFEFVGTLIWSLPLRKESKIVLLRVVFLLDPRVQPDRPDFASVTAADLADACSLSEGQVLRALSDLRKRGLLIQRDRPRLVGAPEKLALAVDFPALADAAIAEGLRSIGRARR